LLVQVSTRTVLIFASAQTQFVDRNFNGISLSDLHTNDRLQVTGRNSHGQFFASRIRDLSLPAVINISVKGDLGSMPSPTLICLANATNVVVTPNGQAQTAVSCNGLLPIYVNGSTRFLNEDSARVSLGDLKIGDHLQVSGALSN